MVGMCGFLTTPISPDASQLRTKSVAADQEFLKTNSPDAKGNRRPVNLVFSDARETIQVRAEGQVLAEAYARAYPSSFPALYDADENVARAYGAHGLPTLAVLDRYMKSQSD